MRGTPFKLFFVRKIFLKILWNYNAIKFYHRNFVWIKAYGQANWDVELSTANPFLKWIFHERNNAVFIMNLKAMYAWMNTKIFLQMLLYVGKIHPQRSHMWKCEYKILLATEKKIDNVQREWRNKILSKYRKVYLLFSAIIVFLSQ